MGVTVRISLPISKPAFWARFRNHFEGSSTKMTVAGCAGFENLRHQAFHISNCRGREIYSLSIQSFKLGVDGLPSVIIH